MKKILVISMALITCACIKPPDDGMDLGDPTTADALDQAYADALGNVPDTQAFHVNDRGVYRATQTVFSSTQPQDGDIQLITKIDSQYIYYSDQLLSTGATTDFKIQRAGTSGTPPTPTPAPTAAPTPTATSQLSSKFKILVANIKSKVNFILGKVTIQVSTAVGDTLPRPRLTIRNESSLKIMAALGAPNDNTTHQYFGLKTFKHVIITSNTSQIKEGKVNATHIEYNDIATTSAGTSKKIHWVFEVSNEVPELFNRLVQCGSMVVIVNNGQVPLMFCNNLESFTFGSN
jgi:hypothetical protein